MGNDPTIATMAGHFAVHAPRGLLHDKLGFGGLRKPLALGAGILRHHLQHQCSSSWTRMT
jgi:hypothetical protein